MKLAEILIALFALNKDEVGAITDEEKQKAAKVLGIDIVPKPPESTELSTKLEAQGAKLALVLEENRELSRKLSELNAKAMKARKDEVIGKALSDGKILPKNREKWEGFFDKDPEGTAALLAEKGAEIDLSERGKGSGGDEGADAETLAAAKLLADSDPEGKLTLEAAIKIVESANKDGGK